MSQRAPNAFDETGDVLESLLVGHRSIGDEMVDHGWQLLSQMVGDFVLAQSGGLGQLVHVVWTESVGHLLRATVARAVAEGLLRLNRPRQARSSSMGRIR
jgi:hypothetical protein